MSPIVPPEHINLLAALGAPIAEFRVSKFTLILLLFLTGGAVVLGLALGFAYMWALVSCRSAKERVVIALVGVIAVVFLYISLYKSKRRHSARDHLTAHLGHVLGFGMLYLFSATGRWRRARQVRGLRILAFSTGIARRQRAAPHLLRWKEIATGGPAARLDQPP